MLKALFRITLPAMVLFSLPEAKGQKIDTSLNYKSYFDEFKVDGSFVLYDLKLDQYKIYNPRQFNEEFCPASTFKICNALIGLETAVIKDENFIIPWDSIIRKNTNWDRDNNLIDAFKNSTVWYFQELARRVGENRMKYWVEKLHYGNENIKGGIDDFWLRGELRITPRQQIDFLVRLYSNQLPISQRSLEILKKIMIVEKTEDFILRAKTGWALVNNTGWYVGYVERKDSVFFFACCIQGNDFNMTDFGKSRIEITMRILKDLKIIK